MKHTQGKWTIYDDPSPIIMARINDENYDIAVIPNEYLDQEMIQANAKLIAAAPEMLEALQEMINAFRKSSDVPTSLNNAYFKCKEAIKKATQLTVRF